MFVCVCVWSLEGRKIVPRYNEIAVQEKCLYWTTI